MPGKVDWLARQLPTEGERAGETRVGELARDDVVRCKLDERLGDVRGRIEDSPYGFALVVAEDGETVLGRLRGSVLQDADPDATAESAMSPGPSTVRADTAVEDLREKLDKRDLRTAIVTTPEGRLVGVVRRRDLD